jgi:hypothetical protein
MHAQEGKTPFDLARENAHEDVALMLLE